MTRRSSKPKLNHRKSYEPRPPYTYKRVTSNDTWVGESGEKYRLDNHGQGRLDLQPVGKAKS